MPAEILRSPTTLNMALAVARLSLVFARVERVTRHEDGVRPETDTDHTVMLGLVACALCPHHLDHGEVAQFALVHDLVEVHAGDTQTLTISDASRTSKAQREAAALIKLREDFGADSWMVAKIEEYERQEHPAARYVRVLDKVLPKLTHLLNGCIAARRLTDRAGFVASHTAQLTKMRADYPELGFVTDLLEESMKASEDAWPADVVVPL